MDVDDDNGLTEWTQPLLSQPPATTNSQLRTYHEVMDEIYSKVTNVGASAPFPPPIYACMLTAD